MLTMSRLAYTTETMSLNNALEALTFRSSYHIHKRFTLKDVNGNGITKVQCIKSFELSQVFLGCYSSLLKVAQQRLRGMLFLLILETQLNSSIAIFFYSLYLSNNTRTCFDNSAWYIFTLGTENGCHSDFFS